MPAKKRTSPDPQNPPQAGADAPAQIPAGYKQVTLTPTGGNTAPNDIRIILEGGKINPPSGLAVSPNGIISWRPPEGDSSHMGYLLTITGGSLTPTSHPISPNEPCHFQIPGTLQDGQYLVSVQAVRGENLSADIHGKIEKNKLDRKWGAKLGANLATLKAIAATDEHVYLVTENKVIRVTVDGEKVEPNWITGLEHTNCAVAAHGCLYFTVRGHLNQWNSGESFIKRARGDEPTLDQATVDNTNPVPF